MKLSRFKQFLQWQLDQLENKMIELERFDSEAESSLVIIRDNFDPIAEKFRSAIPSVDNITQNTIDEMHQAEREYNQKLTEYNAAINKIEYYNRLIVRLKSYIDNLRNMLDSLKLEGDLVDNYIEELFQEDLDQFFGKDSDDDHVNTAIPHNMSALPKKYDLVINDFFDKRFRSHVVKAIIDLVKTNTVSQLDAVLLYCFLLNDASGYDPEEVIEVLSRANNVSLSKTVIINKLEDETNSEFNIISHDASKYTFVLTESSFTYARDTLLPVLVERYKRDTTK